jgi:hypothetical protein
VEVVVVVLQVRHVVWMDAVMAAPHTDPKRTEKNMNMKIQNFVDVVAKKRNE